MMPLQIFWRPISGTFCFLCNQTWSASKPLLLVWKSELASARANLESPGMSAFAVISGAASCDFIEVGPVYAQRKLGDLLAPWSRRRAKRCRHGYIICLLNDNNDVYLNTSHFTVSLGIRRRLHSKPRVFEQAIASARTYCRQDTSAASWRP